MGFILFLHGTYRTYLPFLFSIPSMPTIINIQNADSKAQDIYVLQLQIREATQKLTMPTLGKSLGT